MRYFFRHIVVLFLILGSSIIVFAQVKPFSNLDLSLNGGTTGIGFDVSSNIADWVRVRAGFDVMPRLEMDARFEIASMDANGVISRNFTSMNQKLKTLTGYEVSDYIDMTCKPTFYNFKLLVDIHPFKKSSSLLKNFYFSTGFYWGSSEIGRAVNSLQGAQSLNGILMYNHLYNVAVSGEPLVVLNVKDEFDGKMYEHYVYLDPYLTETIQKIGRLGANIGNYSEDVVDEEGNVVHKKGTPYLMEPQKDGTVRATVNANSFKPYLGIGYGGRLFNNNDRYHISADLGFLLWGGKPDIFNHEGVNLSKDVENIQGKVGEYVDLLGKLTVYPVFNIRFTYSLFK